MKLKFIVFTVIVILLVVCLGLFLNRSSSGPSKLDGFAHALTDQGANFYGAFWCPHCQATKALFGSSKQFLPYTECSTPSRDQNAVCNDKKIESYPSWTFKDGISLVSDKAPSICELKPVTGESPSCNYVRSKFYKVWIFPDYKFVIKSPTDPIKTGNVWKFPSDAMSEGEITLQFLADQIHYTLPK